MTALDLDRAKDAAGTKSKPPFEFNSEGAGANTRIDYKLVDHRAGLSAKGSVVLDGRVSVDDVAAVIGSLEGGRIFNPSAAGLPDLSENMPSRWDDDGGAVHVIERVAYTASASADYLPSADQVFEGLLGSDYAY